MVRPLPPRSLAAVALAICAGIALYCLIYSALAGTPESTGEAFAWSLVNILPWLLAFEGGKRSSGAAGVLAVLAAAFIASLLLQALIAGGIPDLAFQAIRRLPGLFITAALIGLLHLARSRGGARSRQPVAFPVEPTQIDWVAAAGNYIEIRAAGRTLIHRASMGAAELELRPYGFVRIHRSTLVRRDRIARVRTGDVILVDGTSLKTGKRYRSALLG